MHTFRAMSISPRRTQLLKTLGLCAIAHAGLVLSPGCSHANPTPDSTVETTEAPVVDVTPWMREIEEAFEPVSLSATSDLKDAALARQRKAVEHLHEAPVDVGRAAWKRFGELGADRDDLRVALLDIASHCAPKEMTPRLVKMVEQYDPKLGMRVRANAVHILPDIAPKEAKECLEPLVRTPKHSATLPDQDSLLDAWIRASRKLGELSELDVKLIAAIAVDVEQPADARYRAVAELGRVRSTDGQKALEFVLVESSADGYLRIKAAQAIEDSVPQADACAIFDRVADRESDQNFLRFLADMISRHCP